MGTTHTPGPWEWNGENMLWGASGPHDRTVIESGDDGKPYGMHNALIVHNADDGMAQANRRLIAAAPDLLEALQWYVEEDDVIEGMEGNEPWLEGRARAIAAIAKATQP